MPILREVPLILVDAAEINFKDKEGKLIKKWKYSFLGEDEKLRIGYDNNGIYKDDVQIVMGFDKSKAKNYYWELKEFAGETREQLWLGALPKVKNK